MRIPVQAIDAAEQTPTVADATSEILRLRSPLPARRLPPRAVQAPDEANGV